MWFYDDVVCHMMYPAYSFDFPEDLELIKKNLRPCVYIQKKFLMGLHVFCFFSWLSENSNFCEFLPEIHEKWKQYFKAEISLDLSWSRQT